MPEDLTLYEYFRYNLKSGTYYPSCNVVTQACTFKLLNCVPANTYMHL
jgi:hypothetical protein